MCLKTQGARRGVPMPASKRFDDQFFKILATLWALSDMTCRQILVLRNDEDRAWIWITDWDLLVVGCLRGLRKVMDVRGG